MKTEQIAEKAKEVYPYRNIFDKPDYLFIQVANFKREGYVAGYLECQKEWQEKSRWIPVEERLPNENKKYLVKDLYGSIHTAIFNINSNRWSFFGYSDTITHYREIIE